VISCDSNTCRWTLRSSTRFCPHFLPVTSRVAAQKATRRMSQIQARYAGPRDTAGCAYSRDESYSSYPTPILHALINTGTLLILSTFLLASAGTTGAEQSRVLLYFHRGYVARLGNPCRIATHPEAGSLMARRTADYSPCSVSLRIGGGLGRARPALNGEPPLSTRSVVTGLFREVQRANCCAMAPLAHSYFFSKWSSK
jgi:hypothetical protein